MRGMGKEHRALGCIGGCGYIVEAVASLYLHFFFFFY